MTVHEKGLDALESFRLARFLMHSQVYNHHATLICEKMLQRAIEIAIRDGIIREDIFKISNPNFLNDYHSLDDSSLIQLLLKEPESKAYKLANDLQNRCLLKRGYELNVTQHSDAILKMKITRMNSASQKELEDAIAEKCNCDADLIIVKKLTTDNSLFDLRIEEGKSPILIQMRDGSVRQIDEISSLFREWMPVTKFFVFCPEAYRTAVRACTESTIRQVLT